MQAIIPYLWFDQQAETAANLYSSIFPDSRILSVSHYHASGAAVSGQAEGSVMSVSFSLNGLEMVALNGGPYYSFSPAVSFFVHCRSVEELDGLWAVLSDGGEILMPLDAYPFSAHYGWLADRFGVNWQLMLRPEAPGIVPCLLFTGQQFGKAEEAANLYTAAIPASSIRTMERQADGTVLYASFTLNNQPFTVMDSGYEHGFTFTPAISFLLNCESQAEVDRLWATLTEGGVIEQCGWIQDRFGVSWQIVPGEMFAWLQDDDPVKAERVMQAMLAMRKIDLEALRRAYLG